MLKRIKNFHSILKNKLAKTALIISIVAITLLPSIVAIADTYTHYLTITVTDNTSTDRTAIPLLLGINSQSLISANLLDSSGNQTAMKEGTTDKKYGVSGNVSLFIESLSSQQSRTYKFYTGYSPSTPHSIIVGNNGYITADDADNIELSGNSSIVYDGYIDTTAGSSKNLVNKPGSIRIFVSPSVSGNITAGVVQASNVTGTTTTIAQQGQQNNQQVASQAEWWGNTFTANASGWMYQAQIGLAEYGTTPGNFYVNIYNTLSGNITGANITSTSVVANTIVGGNNTFTFTNPVYITEGTTYAFACNAPSGNVSAGNYINMNFHTTTAYGNLLRSTNAQASWQINSAVASAQFEIKLNANNKEISATGVSSGEHIVNVTNNSTTLGIQIDGGAWVTTSNVTAQNSTSSYYFNQSNTSAYIESIEILTGGNRQLYYAPNAMIVGTTLPDRESTGGSQNGTITWGSNPANTIITIGGWTSFESSVPASSISSGDSYEMADVSTVPTGMFVDGIYAGTLTPEFKQTVADAAAGMGMPEASLWFMLWFGASIAIALSVLIFTGSPILAFVIGILVLWLGTPAHVIPFGVVLVMIILGFCIIIITRH